MYIREVKTRMHAIDLEINLTACGGIGSNDVKTRGAVEKVLREGQEPF